MSEFTIRRAIQSDAEEIQECLERAFAPFQSRYTPEAFRDTVPTIENVRQRFSTMALFVAEFDGAVIGTISWYPKPPDEGFIRGMAVVAEWQGKGVARQLLAAAEAEIREQGSRRVGLDTVDPLQRAIRFYEKHGYRRTGHVEDLFGMPIYEFVKELV